MAHSESAVVGGRPGDKDHSSNDRETTRKQNKGVKESWTDSMTAVPVPVPEYNKASSFQSASASIIVETSSASVAQLTTFSPLSPLLSISPSDTGLGFTGTYSAPSSESSSVPPKTTSERVATTKSLGPRHLSMPIIVALAISSVIFVLVFLLAIKTSLRPRRRIHPTPSRPILDDTQSDDDLKVDGSPLFGCDGRQSLPGGNGLWTQYVQPAPQSPLVAEQADVKLQNYSGEKEAQAFIHEDSGPNDEIPGKIPSHGNGHPLTPANSLQRVPSALIHLTDRLSNVSMSLYANHVARNSKTDKHTPLTADGHPAIERNLSGAPRSADDASGVHQEEKRDGSSRGFAYDGADVLTPKLELPSHCMAKATLAPPAITKGGRSRIKSTYYTMGYPRISAAAPLVTSQVYIPSTKPVTPQQAPRKSASQRVRDAHALTLALGIESPELSPSASTRLTLYPDDSLSVNGEADTQIHKAYGSEQRRNCSGKEKTSNVFYTSQTCDPRMLLPHADTHTALGNLMLIDYSSKSLASIATRDTTIPSSIPIPPVPSTSNIKSYLSSDKPPRVPSPPPLPSLAQLALAHENPESFANYRSPTYSIYGLYENERKSRVGLYGY